MTNNPTIDGVSRDLLERLLTDACNENWSDLNELLHSSAACRCRRFGKDNPHWPCPVHSVQVDQHNPTAAMTEAGCQAYMDADGMIGIMHNSSMGHAYVAMRELDPEVAALQSTIAQLRARVQELESGRVGGIWLPRELGDGLAELIAEKARVCGAGAFDIWEEICERFGNTQPVPVAIDERSEFEQFVRREWVGAPVGYCDKANRYRDDVVQRAWVGWQARACLDATAALNGERK